MGRSCDAWLDKACEVLRAAWFGHGLDYRLPRDPQQTGNFEWLRKSVAESRSRWAVHGSSTLSLLASGRVAGSSGTAMQAGARALRASVPAA